jgi:hypothetical protein
MLFPGPMMLAPQMGFGYVDPSQQQQQQFGEPNAKKAKSDTFLYPADEYALFNPAPITLHIVVPVDTQMTAWNLNGQTLSIPDLSITSTVKDLKELLALNYLGGLQAGKQQIKSASLGFLKDTSSLAAYNLKSDSVLELSLKSRGGKK